MGVSNTPPTIETPLPSNREEYSAEGLQLSATDSAPGWCRHKK